MISIIIPVVYDRGWLDDCIKSALNQDFEDYEIILASDNNPDMYVYAHKYGLKFSLNEGKHNLSTNYNNAVKIARGEYLKMLMDDDLLTPNCLKDLYENIKDYDLIYAGAINFTGRKEQIVKPHYSTFKSVYEYDGIHCGTVMIKTSVFRDIGGNDESLDCMEDRDLYLNLLSQGYKMTFVNKIVYRYRVHLGQKSYRPTPERIRTKRLLQERYRKYLLTT
jgi:glycosyltransferase involved in cell wall biosynthesis